MIVGQLAGRGVLLGWVFPGVQPVVFLCVGAVVNLVVRLKACLDSIAVSVFAVWLHLTNKYTIRMNTRRGALSRPV